MSDRRRVYVHVGLDKTGTTSLQHWCAKNRQYLIEEHGVRYPKAGAEYDHHMTLANLCGFGWTEDINRLSNREGRLGHLRAFYKELLEKELILSSEHFSFNIADTPAEKLKRVLGDAFEIVIVLVLRSPVSWIRSRYSEEIKWGYRGSFETFLQGLNHGLLNMEAQVSFWRRHFGETRTKVLLFEDIRDDIVGNLMTEMVGDSVFVAAEQVRNPGLKRGDLTVLRSGLEMLDLPRGIPAHRFALYYQRLPQPAEIKRINEIGEEPFSEAARHRVMVECEALQEVLPAEMTTRILELTQEAFSRQAAVPFSENDRAYLSDYAEHVVSGFVEQTGTG
ncbi:MAG: hypothetical protein ABJO67_17400 [Pseudoruegeria sp.]